MKSIALVSKAKGDILTKALFNDKIQFVIKYNVVYFSFFKTQNNYFLTQITREGLKVVCLSNIIALNDSFT